LSDDEAMDDSTAKRAVEAPNTTKATETSTAPGIFILFSRQLYIQKEKNKINPQLQQKKKKWN
jgi:hypothetical protein